MKKPPIPTYIGEPSASAKSTGITIAYIVFFLALGFVVYRLIRKWKTLQNGVVAGNPGIDEQPASTNPVIG